ncbi:protein kinase family protein [Streptomyces pseudovenezuelae]|uniref:Protein kinase domain-containing protein n=1 Tax=Streptomyces pseudovenezuelae TaxID=67350 RepID=A0ABT6LW04_9ACTN|nr:protein kinase family protein [Streptomyces pseudovenezuelae]MDH6220491.1 hypothetical protein [Streptomyces pseudovenezuelae]
MSETEPLPATATATAAADTGTGARLAAHTTVGTRLSLLSDLRLADAVAAAPAVGSGIGGRRAEMEVEGTAVFVKRVPLTDVELRPEHVRSTANLFGLPTFYQYGAGSAGFGAWRELAAHLITTAWVLRNEYAGFPLLYHWRVLPDQPPTDFADEFGGIEGAVTHWDGSDAVRRRLEAIGRADFSLVLFLEHLPRTLGDRLADVPDHRWAADALSRGTEFMSSRGFVHFDAHFANVLTDDRQIYFADFGLALSRDFELSPQEAEFLTDHLVYDRSYAPTHLLRHHLPEAVRGGKEHGVFLREWSEGRRPATAPDATTTVPPDIAAVLDRHAPHALVLDGFHRRLLTESKRTPFPAAEVRRALDARPAHAHGV